MLTLEEVKPTCIYWANRFQSRNFEFNELYAEAYIIAIKQTTVKTLQKSIKGCLLRFMIKRQRLTNICQPFQDDFVFLLSVVDSDLIALHSCLTLPENYC